MNKITFSQAAQQLGVHVNTLKNWQKAGRLPSAQKQKIRNKDTWIVDMEEVREVSKQHSAIRCVRGDCLLQVTGETHSLYINIDSDSQPGC